MRIQGLEARQGETVFAFLVLRFTQPVQRAALADVVRQLAALIPDADTFIEEMPEDVADAFEVVGMPWQPPEPDEVDAQRRIVANAEGIAEAWFFQTGTGLPSEEDDDEDEDDDDEDDDDLVLEADDDDDDEDDDDVDAFLEQAFGESSSDADAPVQIYPPPADGDDAADDDDADDDDDDDDDEEEHAWSHGPPPMLSAVPFPVDGYPQIIEELDWEDFGIAFKLAGPSLAGEATVLVGFHALWLTPYGGRHRNAAVTIDRTHHSAHLWVDRFAVLVDPAEQVGHLLWVLSCIDQVTPVVHARFGGASMEQKYGGLMGETGEPFVLGGNPLLAVHAEGGEDAVDRWIADQSAWSTEEVAQMLRELAIELITADVGEDADDDEEEEDGEAVDAIFADAEDDEVDDEDDENDDEAEDEAEDEEEAEDDEEADDVVSDASYEDEKRAAQRERDAASRLPARLAADVLVARAQLGTLDPRVANVLRPQLAKHDTFDSRRIAVARVLGALRDRASVPALIAIIAAAPVLESEAKPALFGDDRVPPATVIAAAADALAAIGDHAALPALTTALEGNGARPAVAHAVAALLSSAPEPHEVSDAIVDSLIKALAACTDEDLASELHFAFGHIARVVPPLRRVTMRARLNGETSALPATLPTFARNVALAMAAGRLDAVPASGQTALRQGMQRALTTIDRDHATTVRNIRFALRVGAIYPQLVDGSDLGWLLRFEEPDIRASAHALLATLGTPATPVRMFDTATVAPLSDVELATLIAEPNLAGRAALVAEAGRRGLVTARTAIIAAATGAVARARDAGDLLEPDAKLLAAAVEALRAQPDDGPSLTLFDRMLRHPNPYVKWDLLADPPASHALRPGMEATLAANWGWQGRAAAAWLEATAAEQETN